MAALQSLHPDILPRVLDAQLEEARQLMARREELRQRVEEAAMRGRVEAAVDLSETVTGYIREIRSCLRLPRDLDEFMRCFHHGQLQDDRQHADHFTQLHEWKELAEAMNVPVPTDTYAEVQRHQRHYLQCLAAQQMGQPEPRPSSPLARLSDHHYFMFAS